jgi:putative nucleotidyltransferase with HDIG domain
MATTIEIAQPVIKGIGTLADELGVEAYVVGGYVRDALLGKVVNDIDVLVVGSGIEFAKAVAGKFGKHKVVLYEKFGTAMMTIQECKIEFVGARKESYAHDSRNPVVETGTLFDDLSRRDFTVNALAAGINAATWGQVTDHFHGIDDLALGVLRTPLDPLQTFDDDPLRIMRAIRFASKLGFTIEQDTLNAIPALAGRLSIISQERITDEFMKIMASPRPSIGLRLLQDTGIMRVMFPEVADLGGVDQRKDFHHKDVFLHTCIVVDNVAAVSDNVYLRLAALLHDIAKPKTKKFYEGIGWTFHGHEELGARMVKHIFRRFKLPMDELPFVEKLVRLHLRPIALVDDGVTDSAVRRLLFDAGEAIDDLMALCRADITSKNPKLVVKYTDNYSHVLDKMKEVEEKDKMRAFQPPVRGEEIMAVCDIPPGRLVGVLKTRIENAILDGDIPNEHDPALAFLLSIKDDVIRESAQ